MSDLPQGWAISSLGDVAGKGQYGWTTKASSSGSVKFLRTTDITKREVIWTNVPFCEEPPDDLAKFILKDGDIVISRAGSVGFNKLLTSIPEMAVFASYLIRFRPSKVIYPKFLAAYLKSDDYWKGIRAASAGIALANVNAANLAQLPIPVPPLAEQKRIANQLDTLLARVQACNDRFDAIPALLKRFRQTVLDAATTGGLTDDWRQSESTPGTQAPDAQRLSSNELPFGWKQYQLRELVNCFDNARIPIKASERAKRQGAFSYYGAFGIIDSIDDFLFDGEYLLLAEDGKNLESRDRPIALIANGKFWVNNHAHVIRPNSALDIRFLLHWLNSKSCDISDLLTGIDQIKLTRGAMDRIPVPLPPANEQAEIVRRVEALFALADRIEARCTTARVQAQRLTPLVLAKAFRGELVPQDPTDEPASALLARIASSNIAVAGKNKQKVPVASKERAEAAIKL